MAVASKPKPAISVVIPVHNGAGTIGLQLEALNRQIDAPPFEVVIVDNRSEDNLAETILASARGARLVRAPRENGVSYARNVGAAAAEAPLLMFCDADDVVSAYWLAHGMKAFTHDDLWSGAAIPVSDREFVSDVAALRRRIGDDPEWRPPVDDQDSAFPILMGGNFGIAAALFRRLRGFDQSLPTQGEDNEFAVRARLAGRRIPIAPTVRIAYRIRTDTASRRAQQYRAARAHALIASRYNLWAASPFPAPSTSLLRWILAASRMLVRVDGRDWNGLLERLAFVRGLCSGAIRYRLLRGIPAARVGQEWPQPAPSEGKG